MSRFITLRLTTFLLSAAVTLPCADGQPPGRSDLPKWVDEVQTYGMLPMLPRRAAEMHISVNGVWAGIGTDEPVLPAVSSMAPVRWQYTSDAARFVKDSHAAGLIVPAIVNGLEGVPALKAKWPNLEAMACRTRDGKPARAGENLLMCTNNPDWLAWEVQFGKRGIDLEADLLLLDTPMSSAFVSGGLLKAGFCAHCMARFRKHLESKFDATALRERLAFDGFDERKVMARLSTRQTVGNAQQPFLRTEPDDLLFREFIFCQEQASFDTRKQLFDGLREHARAQGRKVAFATNAADLGTQNPFGHWIRGIMFADLVDLFVYEQDHPIAGMPSNDAARLPRGKWAAWHKLAHAIHGRRSAAALHASAMGTLLKGALRGKSVNAWLGAQCAEAYAANGAYIIYHVEPFALQTLAKRCWARAVEVAAFVQSHKDLYEGDLQSGSTAAVLFLLNERGRTIPGVCPSYLGVAQGLVEGNYPFDVLFGGDGRYVKDRLSPADLRRYRSIIVPSPIAPTANQKAILRQFVNGGGTLVCQEPEALGLAGPGAIPPSAADWAAGEFPAGQGRVIRLSGELTPTATNDAGAKFFASYDPKHRRQTADAAARLGLVPTLDRPADGLVGAFPIVQRAKNRVVVHLVNYDVDYDRDAVREKTQLRLRMPLGALINRGVKAEFYEPGAAQAKPLPVTTAGEAVSCVVERLAICGTVVFTPRGPASASNP